MIWAGGRKREKEKNENDMIQKKNHNIHKFAVKILSTISYPEHYNKLIKCDNGIT